MDLPTQHDGFKALGVRAMADWSAEQIILVSVSCIVAFAALLASLVAITDARMRARETAADLEKALSELGVQREAASALERSLRCRDAFIDRNVLALDGPEGFSAGAPEVDDAEPEPVSTCRVDDAGSGDLFVVGSDDEESSGSSTDSDSGIIGSSGDGREDDGSVCSVLHDDNEDGPDPRSPTAVSAVRIRPNDIKTVILRRPQPKGGVKQATQQAQDEANRGAAAQSSPSGGNFVDDDDAQCAPEGHLRRPKPKRDEDEDEDELVKDQNPGDGAQDGEAPSRIDIYWLDDSTVSPREGSAKAARGRRPYNRGRRYFCRG